MAETGRIAYDRVGDSILFRTDDIEKFVADSRKANKPKRPARTDLDYNLSSRLR